MIRFTCGRNKGAQIREPAEGIQPESGPGSQGNTCSAIGLLRSDPPPLLFSSLSTPRHRMISKCSCTGQSLTCPELQHGPTMSQGKSMSVSALAITPIDAGGGLSHPSCLGLKMLKSSS